ncbi:alkylated DNA repair protein (DNA oxidative demethylase) [Bradyrhizobium sp. NFR13]|uniref:DNA oxidative demethylase AlkB n=1 Tax=Bradyrhizobium sp. NFR13 TaxID=1566285 RepID=UPI0008E7A5C9|nr:DNA oxidative demethylase AlkB [Bradyrhizobium sp. NFR13]SFL89033.1 alkylated DNA repair protein (DNA oxidative demethylase) [Bradyrhizobium sp. NFR13]
MTDLFADIRDDQPAREELAEGAVLLRNFFAAEQPDVIAALRVIVKAAPFRHLITSGGHTMSVAMTNCGRVGWVSDPSGYRYDPVDPDSGKPWPEMPEPFRDLAARAAVRAGFEAFVPDACLINRYKPGAKLSLHQDKDELDLRAPIVSVSLGLPATFLFGGLTRSAPTRRYRLTHGDVVVWGGSSRLAYHGVAPLPDGTHPVMGGQRINLTFRKTC